MDQGEPSLKPEWLLRVPGTVAATNLRPATSPRVDDQGSIASSRNRSSGRDREQSSQQSSSRRNSGSNGSKRHDGDGAAKSRGYASFGRTNSDRSREKVSDLRDREAKLDPPDDPLRDGFSSFSSCRPERDRLNRTRSKLDTLSRAAGVSLGNDNVSRMDAEFERKFPQLGYDDKNVKQDISRVPSPGIGTPMQSIPLVCPPDGWNSVLAEAPILSEPSNNPVSSTLSCGGSCGTTLSMAETVLQAPLKISTAPQLSVDAQKIEERSMKQCILRPLTPSSNKNSVLSSSDKLKAKGARVGDSNGLIKGAPQLSIQSSSSSVRTPVKTELMKPSQSGSFQILTREQNGAANTTKDCTTNPVSPVVGRCSSVEPPKKSIVNQKLKGVSNGLPLHSLQGPFGERKTITKDRNKFFELLRSKSLNGSGTAIESTSTLIDEQQNNCVTLSLFSSGMKCTKNGNSFCEKTHSSGGSQRDHSDDEEAMRPSEHHDVSAVSEGGSHEQGILAVNRDANSSSEHPDTEVVAPMPQTDNTEATVSIIPTVINADSPRSNSDYDDARLLLEPSRAGEAESCPAEDKPSPEEMAFLLSLGWNEHEVVPPLQQEEIADCLRRNERLQQKFQECRG
ncbi:uncharacterized protein LOC100833022 [Brachypodium distachyon]|uniref:Uncharacterized protein n=1 Tax=Brachypodium distachyon TaxID=15368 RepID=I1IY87_BRADI|nr:uncharacterized protein LOC100833022 [Brachypodium distachyon]KQJ82863.1 hypothetical protein BRADI_5g11670v3 [Brachypodium distachyon]|eukprot:XP_003579854.1 uncharacterized protein LOC100833022 [Brachypodium distachyon]